MPDRLDELRRQRALVQEHLAWLEREITATEGKAAPNKPTVATPLPAMRAATQASAPLDTRVEDVLAHYRKEPATVKQDVRKGCLIYFALALFAVAAVVALFYFTLGPK
ncbi:MAG: hypothetical protein JNK23_02970 [Opitutaceae bacterium]|nr:hypothetical protein [Opitutaceae bacterium]